MTIVEEIRSGEARSMERVSKTISTCRYCHFYQIEGRRGGSCQRLGVPVQGDWKVCAVAALPFAQAEPLRSDPARVETWAGMPTLVSTVTSTVTSSDPQPSLTELPRSTMVRSDLTRSHRSDVS